MDGTHIEAVVGDNEGRPCRGRTGTKTWNVLAACSFNMLYTCIHVGFEGSAYDVTVLRHCLGDVNMRFPHRPSGITL